MEEVQIRSQSSPLTKALRVNSQNPLFGSATTIPVNQNVLGLARATLTPDLFLPMLTVPDSDGSFAMSMADATRGWPSGPLGVFLMPYCQGPKGSRFSIRLFGWREVPGGAAVDVVWIPYLLAELACIACDRSGPNRGTGTNRYIHEDERFCDTITLVKGQANITSPGSNLIASAVVSLGGCRFIGFDFQQTDPVPLNCLWAKA